MPNLTSVGLTAGAPTSGTGTVSTIDNTIGTAGTPSANVQTVQGITSMTALKVDGSAVTQPISGTVTSNATLSAETTKVIGVTRTADGSGNLITSTSNAIDVNIKSGGASGGTALADEGTFTDGTTSFTPIGGYFKTSPTALTTGQGGALALSASRHVRTDLFDGTSAALTSTSGALDINVKSGGNSNGQTTMSGSAPVTIASDQSAVAVKGNLAIASTTSGQTGNLVMGAVTTSAPSYTTAQTDPVSLTTAGAIRVDLASVAGTATPVGSGVQATAPRITLATDSPGIVTLGQTTKSASVPVVVASDQLGSNTFSNSLPISFGPALLGAYAMGANSGTMAAGLAGGSPIFSFRYGGANLAVVRKIIIEADNITTAFVAGAAKFDLLVARSFTASDTGGTAGTLTTNNGKLRTSYATTGISDFRISSTTTLSAGTRTLDAQPISTVEFAVPTSIDADLLPTTTLFQAEMAESPLILAQNEGFVIQATVPGTGTWVFSVRVNWSEVSAY